MVWHLTAPSPVMWNPRLTGETGSATLLPPHHTTSHHYSCLAHHLSAAAICFSRYLWFIQHLRSSSTVRGITTTLVSALKVSVIFSQLFLFSSRVWALMSLHSSTCFSLLMRENKRVFSCSLKFRLLVWLEGLITERLFTNVSCAPWVGGVSPVIGWRAGLMQAFDQSAPGFAVP